MLQVKCVQRFALAATLIVAALVSTHSANAVCNDSSIVYKGGSVLVSPKIFLVYWGTSWPDPANERVALEGFLSNVGGSQYLSAVTQYTGTVFPSSSPVYPAGNPANMLKAVWNDTSSDPAPLNGNGAPLESALYAEVNNALSHFKNNGFPGVDADPDAIIWLAISPNQAYPTNVCAYHAQLGVGQGATATPFVWFPYQPRSPGGSGCYSSYPDNNALVSAIAQHELVEAITDPRVTYGGGGTYRGWMSSDSCAEVGDLCQNEWLSLFPGHYNNELVPLAKRGSSIVNYSVYNMMSAAAAGGSGAQQCVAARETRSDQFYTDVSGNLWHRQGGSGDLGWAPLPGITLASDPTSASWGPDADPGYGPKRIDVLGRDSANHIRHAYTNDGSTFAFDDWGGAPSGYVFTRTPELVAAGPR